MTLPVQSTDAAGGASSNASGAPAESGEENLNPNSPGAPDPDKQRAIEDLHRWKKEAKNLSSSVEQLKAQLAQSQNEKLREKENWKELAEKEAKRAEEAEGKYKGLYENLVRTQKYSAVRASALKAGLRPEAEADLELLPLDDVEFEVTSNNRFIVSKDKEVVENLKKSRPHWFGTEAPPVFNGGGGRGGTGGAAEVTALDLYAIEKKHGRASREYSEAFQKFSASRLKK